MATDGEPLRPYNVRPDALLLNYKAQVFTITPDVPLGVANIGTMPPPVWMSCMM